MESSLPSGDLTSDVETSPEEPGSRPTIPMPTETTFKPVSITVPVPDDVQILKMVEPVVEDKTTPAAFQEPLSNVDATEGDDAKFRCVVSGSSPLEINWFRDNKPIATSDDNYEVHVEQNDVILVVKQVTLDDIGEYRCTVGNNCSQASSDAYLNVIEHPSKWIPPEFTKVPEDVKSVEGNTVTLEARISGKPEPEVLWLKDSTPLKQNARYKMGEDNGTCRLTLLNCTADDSGEYTVEARNEAGLATCSCTLSLQDDTVLPKFVQRLHDTTVGAEGSLKLSTTFVGTPEPEITWLLNGAPIVERTECKLFTEEGSSTLLIDRVLPKDAGQYKCIARNNVGKATTSCNVAVEGVMSLPVAPDNNEAGGRYELGTPAERTTPDDQTSSPEDAASLKKGQVPRAPKFVRELTNGQVFENEDVVLEVIVEGSPSPQVQWMFENEPLVESEFVVTESQGDVHRLIIKKATLDHEGDYTCIALNDLGSCSCTSELLVEELPSGPRFVRELVDTKIAPDQEVVFEVEVEGNPSVTWYKDDVPLNNISKYQMQGKDGRYSLRFTPTGVEDEGEYKCMASNKDGTDTCVARLTLPEAQNEEVPRTEEVIKREEVKPEYEFPEIGVEIKNEPEFVTVPRDLTVPENEKVVIRCSVTGNPVPEVKWFNDKKEVPKEGRVRYVADVGYSSLVIDSAKLEDGGVYTCVASNPSGEVSTTVKLLVDEAKEHGEILTELQSLPLQAIKDLPVVKEEIDKVFKEPSDAEMNLAIDLESEQLFESPAASEEEAPITVDVSTPVATHPAEKDTLDAVPKVVATEEFPYSNERPCLTKPRVETIRDTYTADDHNTCLAVRVQGSPETVEWFKDGVPLSDTSKYKIHCNEQTAIYELTIRDCEPSDSGEYRCIATNSKGQDSCPIKLDIQPLSGPPKFLRLLVDAEVLSGTSVKFIVEVVGSPTPDVAWFKDGCPLQNDAKYCIESEGITYSLTVKDCTTVDCGVFKCIGSNVAGQVETSALLTVSTMLVHPPSFEDKPEDTAIEILEQGDIKLEATIAGRPKPTVEWFKNEQPLQQGSHYKIEQNDDTYKLIIVGVTMDDSASYKCIASNDGGIAERTYHVDIEGIYCH